jgi:hypothetical protein
MKGVGVLPTMSPDTPPSVKGVSPGERAVRLPLSVAALLLPALLSLVRLAAGLGRRFDFAGDEAVLEAVIRHVGTQLVGPYSRFGFRQPGPAYFYVQAPFYWLTGAAPRALFLGALCINLGSAVACVVVVRRFLGEPAARWTAVVVGALVGCLTPVLVANPWNPYVLALPVLLTILLAAAGANGSRSAAAGAAVVGSGVVQTHVAAAATIGAVFIVAGVVAGVMAVSARRSGSSGTEGRPAGPTRRRRRPGATIIAAGALLVLIWVPPLIEQATHSPGNGTKLVHFFRTAHPEYDRGIDHSVPAAIGEVAAQLTVVPFGHQREEQPTRPVKVAVTFVGLVLAVAVVAVGWRRRHTFIAVLGAVSVAAPLVALWSATHIVGEVYPYLLVWTSALLLPAWIGAGVLLQQRSRTPRGGHRGAGRVAGGLVVGVAAVLAWSMLRAPLPAYGTAPDVGSVAGLALPWLVHSGTRQVRIRVGEHSRWPLAAGVLVRLEKDGFDVTVDREWTPLFGDRFGPTGREGAELWLTAAAGTPPGAESELRLGVVGGSSVWAGPMSPP